MCGGEDADEVHGGDDDDQVVGESGTDTLVAGDGSTGDDCDMQAHDGTCEYTTLTTCPW